MYCYRSRSMTMDVLEHELEISIGAAEKKYER